MELREAMRPVERRVDAPKAGRGDEREDVRRIGRRLLKRDVAKHLIASRVEDLRESRLHSVLVRRDDGGGLIVELGAGVEIRQRVVAEQRRRLRADARDDVAWK